MQISIISQQFQQIFSSYHLKDLQAAEEQAIARRRNRKMSMPVIFLVIIAFGVASMVYSTGSPMAQGRSLLQYVSGVFECYFLWYGCY